MRTPRRGTKNPSAVLVSCRGVKGSEPPPRRPSPARHCQADVWRCLWPVVKVPVVKVPFPPLIFTLVNLSMNPVCATFTTPASLTNSPHGRQPPPNGGKSRW